MKDLSAGYVYNNYIGNRKIKNLFNGLPFKVELKTITVNGQKRGCSGFITNTETEKVCYLTTEPFFDGGIGSGLYRDKNKAIMMRTTKNTKDYTGGFNRWLSQDDIVKMAQELTK